MVAGKELCLWRQTRRQPAPVTGAGDIVGACGAMIDGGMLAWAFGMGQVRLRVATLRDPQRSERDDERIECEGSEIITDNGSGMVTSRWGMVLFRCGRCCSTPNYGLKNIQNQNSACQDRAIAILDWR